MHITGSVLLVFFIISAVASAATDDDAQAKILVNENTYDEKGNYRYRFETSNGITRDETGEIRNAGQPDEFLAVFGSYGYTDSDGNRVFVEYTADENGFIIQPPVMDISIAALPPNIVATVLG